MTAPAAILPHDEEEEEEEEEVAAMLSRAEKTAAAMTGEQEEAAAAILAHGKEAKEAPAAMLPHGEERAAAMTAEEEVAAAILSRAEETAAAMTPEEEEEEAPAATLSHAQENVLSPVAVWSCAEEKAAATLPEEEEQEAPAAVLSHPEGKTAAMTPEEESTQAPAAVLPPAEQKAAPTLPEEAEEEEEEEEEVPVALPVAAAGSSGRRGGEEDVTAAGWRGRRKHVFVLSEAGKPIYSRHGNEEALAATMGVMMALVSFIQSGGNAIRAICSEDRTLVFEQRGPLLLVSVSRTRQPAAQLRRELAFVHEQILSLLTRGGIARVFARRRGYDLRRLLAGAEAVLDRLLAGAAADGRLLLGAAPCLPLAPALRRGLSGALRRAAAAAVPAPALALLAAGGRLVTAARQRALAEGGRLWASDLHLLLNLLGGAGAGAGEVWTPVCLPRFNPDGYFYAYAAALGEEEEEEEGGGGGGSGGGVTLILLSTEREGFYGAAACRRRLREALRAQGWLRELAAAARGGAGYGPARPGAPELRHFLYKPLEGPEEMQQLPQFTSPELEEPYAGEEERQRLFDLYHALHGRVHSPRRPLRLLYHVAEKETLLAWVTSRFELYGCFSPLVTKAGAIGGLTKLLRWLKREEEWLFIRYPPPYCAAPARPEAAEG